MNKSLLAIAVASLFSPISNLHAQEAAADETMVVTANRFEQSIDKVNFGILLRVIYSSRHRGDLRAQKSLS